MIDDYITFKGKVKLFAFSCYLYPDGIITNRVEIYENNYNDYIFKKFNEE